MIIKRLLTLCAAGLVLASCVTDISPKPEQAKQEPIFTADELKFLAGIGQDTKLGQEDLDRIIGDAIGFLDTDSSTRAGAARRVAEIKPLNFPMPTALTRSGEEIEIPEELFYVVNFEEDAGYSVIAADSRIEDEIAVFVGHGNLDPETNDNPGLAIMLSRLDAYAANSIAKYERWQDSVEVALIDRLSVLYPDLAGQIEAWLAFLRGSTSQTRAGLPPYNPDREGPPILIDTFTTYGPWTVDSRIAPMIPVEWGQGVPFNTTASLNEGKPVYAGCVAIATVQLMAYWKHPTTYNDQYIDWDTTCNYTGFRGNRPDRYKTWLGPMSSAPTAISNTIADYIWYIGQDIDMDYGEIGVSGSSAESQDAINLLKRKGYSASSRQGYSKTPVVTSLSKNRPVYIRGDSSEGGHAWLIDGLLGQTRTTTREYVYYIPELNPVTPIPRMRTASVFEVGMPDTREFLHNNWGWDATDNGYYVQGIFNTTPGPTMPSNTRAQDPGNFYNLGMWTEICR